MERERMRRKVIWGSEVMMWTLVACLILSIVLLWFTWGILGPHMFQSLYVGPDVSSLGQWGDSFGAFNALISSLAFSAVLVTLVLQARTVRDQAKDLHRQRFESSFFELLKLLRELRGEVKYTYSDEFVQQASSMSGRFSFAISSISGSDGFRRVENCGYDGIVAAVREVRHWIGAKIQEDSADVRGNLVKVYTERVFRRSESELAPYLRIIYTLLARLREDKILTAEEKAQYGNLLRSQLTSHEITLVAINGLSPISKDLGALLTESGLNKTEHID